MRTTNRVIQRGEEPVLRFEADQESDEYKFGVEAYRLGWTMESCMFQSGSQIEAIRTARRRWMTGWLDERSRWMHRDIWDRWGIEF